MLPDHEPSFVEVARTPQKVEQPCSRGRKHDWEVAVANFKVLSRNLVYNSTENLGELTAV